MHFCKICANKISLLHRIAKVMFFCKENLTSVYSKGVDIEGYCGIIKGRSPSNGKLSDFFFYIDSTKSAHRKFKK